MKSSVNYDEEAQVPIIPPPEIKRPRLNRWHVITAVLALIIVAQGVLYVGSSLEHNSLRLKYDTLNSNYDQLRYQINQRSQHYDASKFITPNNPSVEQTVTQITGGWSVSSNRNEFWNDVKAMYDWVIAHVKYQPDGLFPTLSTELPGDIQYNNEMWQFPDETLSQGRGDCEDMAILLCSMILHYNGENYWTECITLEGSKSAHMGVQILVAEDKLTILDPAGHYYTSDAGGTLASESVSTEINNWLDHWKSGLGSDVYVSEVFANYLDETFSSTSEYISWMSSR